MDDLDELLWSCSGDGTSIRDQDWARIHDHLLHKLTVFLQATAHLLEPPSIGTGFFTQFVTNDENNLLEHRLWGTFGVDFPGAEYPCVQGFVYAYRNNKRVVLPTGENHIYIRYARVDATDNDWVMAEFNGPSQWRSYGWSVDAHGEFDGYEKWADI